MKVLTILFLLQITVLVLCKKKDKTPSPLIVHKQSSKIENPNAIKDRKKRIIYKPAYPEAWGMEKKKPFSINWMDYCDPYHCGDYHKPACGMNRRRLKFQWFQSGCHLVLNNACASYRGFLKFDQVDPRYCRAYVMFALRGGCPETCPDTQNPVCAVNVVTNRVTVFKNVCFLYKKNCQGVMQDFVEVSMNVCINDIALAVEALEDMSFDELTKNDLTKNGLTKNLSTKNELTSDDSNDKETTSGELTNYEDGDKTDNSSQEIRNEEQFENKYYTA